MAKPEQVNAGFRLPAELVEWLDQYAAFLSEEGGFSVSRTQALLRLISLSRQRAQGDMVRYKQAKYLGMTPEDYVQWQFGLDVLRGRNTEGYNDADLIMQSLANNQAKEQTIKLGKEGLDKVMDFIIKLPNQSVNTIPITDKQE